MATLGNMGFVQAEYSDTNPLGTANEVVLWDHMTIIFLLLLGTADVDDRLHQLSKNYNSLMDRYRQLKGVKATPVRNQEIDSLLEKIKEVYEETPDHRKPALPPELENL